MKRFFHSIFLLILIVLLVFSFFSAFCFLVVGNQYGESYMGELNEKVDRLKKINGPKIILAGNSNLAFGINSEMIEKECNMPVVNLGMHGGLGNAFQEEMIKMNINEGDIVVLCHTSYNDDDCIKDPPLAWTAIEWRFDLWNLVRKKDMLDMVKAFPNYIINSALLWATGKGNSYSDSAYSRRAFNEYGDVVYKPENGKKDVSELFFNGEITVPEIKESCTNRINLLNEYVSSKGAVLVVGSYPIAYGEYSPSKEEYEDFQKKLDDALECEIISDFCDYFFSYELFYDTKYHLTQEGADIRTRLLVNDIKRFLEKTSE